MQLCKKKNFFWFIFLNWQFRLNFEHFQKNMNLIGYVLTKLQTPKDVVDKCLKIPVSEDPTRCGMLNCQKHSWNLHDSTFIRFIDQFERNWVAKSLS